MNKKELMEKRAKLLSNLEDLQKSYEGKKISAEERAAWDKAKADLEEVNRLIEEEQRSADLAAIRAAVEGQRQNVDNDTEKRQMDAFRQMLLRGINSLTPEQRDAITGVDGSSVMPTSVAKAVEIALAHTGGVMSVAQIIRTAKGENLILPTVNDTTSKAQIVAQYTKGSKDAPTIGGLTLGAFTYRTPIIPISYELLQDAEFDITGLISQLLAEQFGRGLNYDFTTGAGAATTTPKGIVAAANNVSAGSSSAITFDDLLNLKKAVDAAYWAKGKFMLNQNTLIELAKIKDDENRYIWNPNVAAGMAQTIMGHEFVINNDMADIAAGKSVVLFGDLSKYRVRIAKDITAKRFDELLGEYNAIGLTAFMRADGALADAGTHPIAKLTLTGGSGSGSGAGSGSGSGSGL
ncbi:MAG: phage major capsid protein [Bacteroidales bacterium]|nr:phage major capsid protein [Bacteroidales bacterium]